VALALAILASPWPALATPTSPSQQPPARIRANVPASQAAADAAVRDYAAARARLSAIEADLAENSARLDELVAQQDRLQRRLRARAEGMYRRGPFEFIQVLTGSVTFDQFSSLWDALIRINRRDAQAIGELKRTRRQVSRAADTLLRQQTRASAELRRLDALATKAKRDLARDRAAYAGYRRRIAGIDAKRAAAAGGAVAGSSGSASPKRRPTRPIGSGEWKTALASHYGPGSYGVHLASGVVIGPDSMIVAHKTLPFGTLVEFEYRGRRAVASVADRGPYVQGREFDLGPGVIRILGFSGVNNVRWRLVRR
jgi:rare lipoprotein A (peptidoglycan hydrolase)